MKTTFSRAAALGSLCVLLAGTASAAFAQDNDHSDHRSDQGQYRQGQYDQHQFDQQGDYRHSDQYRHAGVNERRRLDRLHAAYTRAAAHGNYSAAERDHAHAQAIRARLHDQHGDQRRDDDQRRDGDNHRDGDNQGDRQDRHDNNH